MTCPVSIECYNMWSETLKTSQNYETLEFFFEKY